MTTMRSLAAAALLLAGGAEPEAWVFFSPDSPDATGIFLELKGMRVRPVLLTGRYFGPERPPSPAFQATLTAAGEVLVVDEEGLRQAAALRISRLPAVAVLHRGRWHVGTGTRLKLSEVLRCSK